MEAFTIKGIVKKIDLGTGFWGVITRDGKEYRPTNLALAMQRESLKVSLKVVPVEEDMGMFMWGETVEIV